MDHAITVRDVLWGGAGLAVLGLAAWGALRLYVACNGDL